MSIETILTVALTILIALIGFAFTSPRKYTDALEKPINTVFKVTWLVLFSMEFGVFLVNQKVKEQLNNDDIYKSLDLEVISLDVLWSLVIASMLCAMLPSLLATHLNAQEEIRQIKARRNRE